MTWLSGCVPWARGRRISRLSRPGAAGRRACCGRQGARRDRGGRAVVLHLGRLARQKGIDVLLTALSSSQAPGHPVAGGRGRRSAAQRSGPAGGRRGSAGAVPRPARRHRGAAGHGNVVAVPSRWEGQPLIVQETLQAGRPLIASRVGGIPDLTGDEAALLVPPEDPCALADALAAGSGTRLSRRGSVPRRWPGRRLCPRKPMRSTPSSPFTGGSARMRGQAPASMPVIHAAEEIR